MTRPDSVSVPREPRARGDAATLLTCFLVILVVVPSQLVVGALGAAGAPSQLFAVGLALWWLLSRLMRTTHASPHRQVVRWWLGAFCVCVLVSYVAAMIRPIDGVEMRAADRAVISVIAWSGLLLIAMDGIGSKRRLDVLLRRVALAGGLMAGLGILQFFSGRAIVDRITIPFLTANSDIVGALSRDGFTRPAATAIHPIEFGVVLTLALPLAVHYALHDPDRPAWRRWFPVAAICLAIPISLSRSAILGALVVALVMLPGLTATQRRWSYAGGAVLVGIIFVAVPGMLGTLTRLFTNIRDDGSALSRTDSYALAWDFISQSPWVGRGLATFLPRYRILDNQYLGVAIDLGLLGLAALLGLLVSGIFTALVLSRRLPYAEGRALARALAAAVTAGAVSFATFDAFSFPMVPSLLFLLLGAMVALQRTGQARGEADEETTRSREDAAPLRHSVAPAPSGLTSGRVRPRQVERQTSTLRR